MGADGIFPLGMKFRHIYLTGDDFLVDFSSGVEVSPGLWYKGVSSNDEWAKIACRVANICFVYLIFLCKFTCKQSKS